MSTSEFVYNGRATRVVFGSGSRAHVEREVQALQAQRALVLCSPEQRALGSSVAEQLGARAAGVFDRAVMHVPVELVAEARTVVASLNVDCVIAVGGGSAIGLAKAIALETSLPILAVPTTYAGSEMTPIFGLTDAGLKRTGTDLRVLPKTVVYDPDLTLTLPVGMSVTSGINAIAHAAEGLYSRDANPLTSLMAEEGIAALARSLPAIVAQPNDPSARADALYGAWLCGTVLGSVGMALHHKLCHTLGGSYNLPHAPTHTIVLPHALAYNAHAVPDAMKRIARAIGHDNAAQGLYELARANGAPVALKEIGMREEQLDEAADIACNNAYWNPRPLEREAIRALLQRAFDGSAPKDGL
ncbi:maleylacetate reductase [Paraburkholderia ginsengiterrae]|uniref:maleylacetate reductase n=1 Tax=Paraburkholderia ginsengiterrae TaxID=1462993 RepID=A0A1A9N4U0_9BURK|nr:maleylacetate reductase [Paraburkholderia ginsengiterrae]OAJ57290.1 maleylacetate reductase [Paraburkholderia ginsengiterrae]OAJ60930.1 maleylacetate reductase [Paraburkholderia ginsengiterrae]